MSRHLESSVYCGTDYANSVLACDCCVSKSKTTGLQTAEGLFCSLSHFRLGEQCDQRALDCSLSGRHRYFGAQQVGDIEHVHNALTERRNMRRRDIEVELRQRGRQ